MPLVSCQDRHQPRQRELAAAELAVRIVANGVRQFVPWCQDCGRWASSSVAHAYIRARGIDPDRLPLLFDNRGLLAICSVKGCGSDDVELNHFAPRAIFGEEADSWPTAYLCRKHHQEWGNRVTPALNPPARLRTTGV